MDTTKLPQALHDAQCLKPMFGRFRLGSPLLAEWGPDYFPAASLSTGINTASPPRAPEPRREKSHG